MDMNGTHTNRGFFLKNNVLQIHTGTSVEIKPPLWHIEVPGKALQDNANFSQLSPSRQLAKRALVELVKQVAPHR